MMMSHYHRTIIIWLFSVLSLLSGVVLFRSWSKGEDAGPAAFILENDEIVEAVRFVSVEKKGKKMLTI